MKITDDVFSRIHFKTLNAQFNPICHMLALLGSHHILHVSSMRVKFHRATLVPKPTYYKSPNPCA